MSTLTARQAKFVECYLVTLNATKAAEEAGYSAKGAEVRGSELLRNRKVAEAISTAQAERAKRVQVTQDWVVETLVENVNRSMQAEEVRDREGNPTGEYVYQGSVANRALELIGKHLGMFTDKVDLTSGGLPITRMVIVPGNPE